MWKDHKYTSQNAFLQLVTVAYSSTIKPHLTQLDIFVIVMYDL